MASDFARIYDGCRRPVPWCSAPDARWPPLRDRPATCSAPGVQGPACARLRTLGGRPLCSHIYGRPIAHLRSFEGLSFEAAHSERVAQRFLALTDRIPPARLSALLDIAPDLGWELVYLAVLGRPHDGLDPWRWLLDGDHPLRPLAIAAIAVHGRWTPERHADAVRILAALPDSAAETALATLRDPATGRTRGLGSPDPVERARAVAAHSGALPGNALRASECRILASRLHPTPQGGQLADRIRTAAHNRELRTLLERSRTRHARRPAVTDSLARADHESFLEDCSWWEDGDDLEEDYLGVPADPPWPLPEPSPPAAAAIAFLDRRGWPETLAGRLDPVQLAKLRRLAGRDARSTGLGERMARIEQEPQALLAQVLDAMQRPPPPEALAELGEAIRLLLDRADTAGTILAAWPVLHPDVRPIATAARHVGVVPHEILRLACQSPLAPARAVPDVALPESAARAWGDPCAHLLRVGAGTLAPGPHPAFEITVRPDGSWIGPGEASDLARLCEALEAVRAALAREPAPMLDALAALAGVALPPGAADTLLRHAAYSALARHQRLSRLNARVRGADLRRLRKELPPAPETFDALRQICGPREVTVAVARAMLQHAHGPERPAPPERPERCLPWAHLLRLVSLTFDLPGAPRAPRARIEHLRHALVHAPAALCRALGLPERALPLLGGGPALEREILDLLRDAFDIDPETEATSWTCTLRPLPRAELLERVRGPGVPLARALSPHHTFYGIGSRSGYLSVFEAIAVDDSGHQAPALVLDALALNAGLLDPARQDLLLLLDAIAQRLGLDGLVVPDESSDPWDALLPTLQHGRRWQEGRPVRLLPADPALWSALTRPEGADLVRGSCRRLAPFDPERDRVQPENAARARALSS